MFDRHSFNTVRVQQNASLFVTQLTLKPTEVVSPHHDTVEVAEVENTALVWTLNAL